MITYDTGNTYTERNSITVIIINNIIDYYYYYMHIVHTYGTNYSSSILN